MPPSPHGDSALLVGPPSDWSDLEAIVRGLGYRLWLADGPGDLTSLTLRLGLCVVDLRLQRDALQTVRVVRARQPHAVLIGIADPQRPGTTVEAVRAGVFDVLSRPVAAHELEAVIGNAREQAGLTAQVPRDDTPAASFGIVGASPVMRTVMDLAQRAATARCGVLICGERGTGREMVARAIHAADRTPRAPFVTIDCAEPAGDVERRLFGMPGTAARSTQAREALGYERLGASSAIAAAHRGVLFLEHLEALPVAAQGRLLRLLRDRTAVIAGTADAAPIDVRPIASADQSIDRLVAAGDIRQDLFERLSLLRIETPPLRQRRDDIPVLAMHFVKEICHAHGVALKSLTRPAVTLLSALPWRGNAVELRTLLERLVLVVPSGLIRLEDVLTHVPLDGGATVGSLDLPLKEARERFERDYIASVLHHHHGRVPEAARALGLQRTNLYRKMRQLRLVVPSGPSRH